MLEDLIIELGKEVKPGKRTWQDVVEEINEKTGENLSRDAVRKRYKRLLQKGSNINSTPNGNEFETLYGDGTVEAQKIVNLTPEQKSSPDSVLKILGYNPHEWELVMMNFSNWQSHTKEQTTKELYAVKFKIKPKSKELDPNEMLEIVDKVFSQKIKPINLPDRKSVV